MRTNIPRTTTLRWGASSGATSYDVYFGTSNPPVLYTNTSGTSISVGPLAASTRPTGTWWRKAGYGIIALRHVHLHHDIEAVDRAPAIAQHVDRRCCGLADERPDRDSAGRHPPRPAPRVADRQHRRSRRRSPVRPDLPQYPHRGYCGVADERHGERCGVHRLFRPDPGMADRRRRRPGRGREGRSDLPQHRHG